MVCERGVVLVLHTVVSKRQGQTLNFDIFTTLKASFRRRRPRRNN